LFLNRIPRILFPLCLLVLAGCAKPAPPTPVTIQGRVQSADGKPVKGVVLIFHVQDDAAKGDLPSAVTDPKDGTFRLTCVPGSYRVTLASLPRHGHADPGGGKAEAPGKEQPADLPTQYRDATTTPWHIQVFERGRDDVVLTLKK
jgi:hypothetical protein